MQPLPARVPLLVLLLLSAGGATDEDRSVQIMNDERLGKLRVEMGAAEVAKELGRPESRTRETWRAYDGRYVQRWTYLQQGLTLEMTATATDRRHQRADSIEARAPCRWKTTRGIGIGSALADVHRAYGKDEDKNFSNDHHVVAGSIYGGVVFDLQGGAVTRIFIGAETE